MAIKEINDKEFKNLLSDNQKPILVDFFATWCGPCKVLSEILEEAEEKLTKKADIYKMDIDSYPDIASELSIMGVPTMILFKNGEVAWRTTGVQTAEKILEAI